MKMLLLLMMVCGCEQSYWVRDADWRARENVESVRATQGGRQVRLSVAALDDARVVEEGSHVRVTPRSRTRTAAWVLMGVGGALITGGAIAFGFLNPSGCHDEGCWVGQTVAGSTLMGLGGSLGMTGLTLSVASAHDAEQ